MARIGLVSYFEEGHVYATFGLAGKLKDAGHEVVYLGIADMAGLIRERGFECVIILQDVFPQHFMTREFPKLQNSGFLRMVREWTLLLNELVTYYSGQQIDSILKGLCLDGILIDSLMPEFAFVSNRNQIPSAMYSALMPHHRDALVPPGTKLMVPDGSVKTKRQIAREWRAIQIANTVFRLAGMITTGKDHRRNVRSLARACRFRLEDIEFNTIFTPMVKLPHLVLCPEEFDFPRDDKANLHYVESLITLNQADQNGLPELNGGKKIVFCSLGSQSFQSPNTIPFLNKLIDIFVEKPDWHLVIALGNYIDRDGFHQGDNVSVYNWVLQAPILKTCTYMINHGGLGTVKECIYYGVPMISLPFLRDQFGNGARVVYHGLGLSERLSGLTRRKLSSLIQKMEDNPRFRDNAAKMSMIFRQRERENKSIELIEKLILI